MDSLAAKFIVFDGPDGCGKTTQRDLLARHLRDQGLDVVTCKDPGGTDIGDRIRHILLDYDLSEMDVQCEALLFMASRAQLVGQVIQPAIKQHKVVLCDRFVSATCAYQGAAGHDMQRIIDLAPYAIGKTWRDLTIVLDVDRTVAAVPPLVEAGITDLRASVSLPTEREAATDFLSPLVEGFRKATGR